MPLPIGHALAGIAFFEARPGFFFKNKWLDAVFFAFLANLPDGDFLPGLIAGSPNFYHHGAFHSLGAALAVSAGAGLIFYLRLRKFWKYSLAVFFIFLFHLLLDFFAGDFTAPYGMPVFWPISGRYYIASRQFFLSIVRSGRSSEFFPSLFNGHNLEAALREIWVLGGLVLLVWIMRRLLDKISRPR